MLLWQNRLFDLNWVEICETPVRDHLQSWLKLHIAWGRCDGSTNQLSPRFRRSGITRSTCCITFFERNPSWREESLHSSADEWHLTNKLRFSSLFQTSATQTSGYGTISLADHPGKFLWPSGKVRSYHSTPKSDSFLLEILNIDRIIPVMIPMNILDNHWPHRKITANLTWLPFKRWTHWLSLRSVVLFRSSATISSNLSREISFRLISVLYHACVQYH